MQIIKYPHPTLRHVSRPLQRVDAELHTIVAEMFELMYAHQGVGLAGNQVDLPYRLFVLNPTADPKKPEEERVYINPVLSSPKGSVTGEEGCLSIPGIFADVTRAERITLNAYTLQGEEVREQLEGLIARVVQHETDHLDGRLFIDRLSTAAALDVREALEEMEMEFDSQRSVGNIPADTAIAERLAELEALRT